MVKLTGVALSAVLGVAGVAHSLPAQAGPYVGLSVGVPVVVAPPLAYAPAGYYYARPPYWAFRDRAWREHEWRVHAWREHEWREHHFR